MAGLVDLVHKGKFRKEEAKCLFTLVGSQACLQKSKSLIFKDRWEETIIC
jgi:hypothetical protein